jgi:dephospho-CoA kinase
MSAAPPIVIGLAGGIGSGKSAVASILAELGCVVIDSDREARAALNLPQVRDQLVRWWGPAIVGPDGKVDRSAVASIIFADDAQRRRLESLVHPLVRVRREEAIERARGAGVPAVVVDAPLLFEAGVDRECDVVVFVDAPRAAREERVRTNRGWDPDELSRREKAQWGLETKRSLADYVLPNDAGPDELKARVRALLDQIMCNTPRP